jgi:hypothetical protein
MMRLLLVVLALSLLGAAALVAIAFAVGVPSDGVHVIVNDRELVPPHAGLAHAVLALVIAACVIGLVLPLTLAVGLVLPLALVAGAVLLVGALLLGVGALALAPLWLPVLLLAWLWRKSRRRSAPAGATMAP